MTWDRLRHILLKYTSSTKTRRKNCWEGTRLGAAERTVNEKGEGRQKLKKDVRHQRQQMCERC